MEILYTATPSVHDAIASLGRTEDVCFSPGNRRLAIAAFNRNRIALFDIDIATAETGKTVAVTGALELSSPALNQPHGLNFIDDQTLIVTNREGDAVIFKLPHAEKDVQTREVVPIQTLPAGGTSLLQSPGSVSVSSVDRELCEILICNNFVHTVTRHLLNRRADYVVSNGEVLLRKWLDIPDSVTVSRDRRWMAVSNHNTHSVLLYEHSPSMNADTDPVGILRGVYYPHGLRFSSDGRYLFVADAGAPYVHIFANDGEAWGGVRHPIATIRIMDESQFQRGRHSPQEGGPKGLDVDAGFNVLVITSECQPLAFFDVTALLRRAARDPHAARLNDAIDDDRTERIEREQRALQVSYELHMLGQSSRTKASAIEAQALVDYMIKSKSWRLTAPLRRLDSALRRLASNDRS